MVKRDVSRDTTSNNGVEYEFLENVPIPRIARRGRTVTERYPLSKIKPGSTRPLFIPHVTTQKLSPEIAKAKRSMHASFTTRTLTINGVKGVAVWRDANTVENKRPRAN